MNNNYTDSANESQSTLPGFLILTAVVCVYAVMEHMLPLAGFESEFQDDVGMTAQIVMFAILIANYIYELDESKILSRFGLAISGVIEVGLAIFVLRLTTANGTSSLVISPELLIMASLLVTGLLSMLSLITYRSQINRYRSNILVGGASGIILGLGLFLSHGYMAMKKSLSFMDNIALYVISAAGLFVVIVALSSLNQYRCRQSKSMI